MKVSACGRVNRAGGCPGVRARCVSPAGIKIAAAEAINSAPDDHFTADPHSGVTGSGSGRVGGAGGCPTVCAGIVPPARVEKDAGVSKSPHTIISLPVHTAVCWLRAGALVVLVAVQRYRTMRGVSANRAQ
jgi:hypothetical protein